MRLYAHTLSKAVRETNSSQMTKLPKISSKIFEPSKMNLKTGLKTPVCSTWWKGWDDFRTFKWIDSTDCPELMMKQVKQLLKSAS